MECDGISLDSSALLVPQPVPGLVGLDLQGMFDRCPLIGMSVDRSCRSEFNDPRSTEPDQHWLYHFLH